MQFRAIYFLIMVFLWLAAYAHGARREVRDQKRTRCTLPRHPLLNSLLRPDQWTHCSEGDGFGFNLDYNTTLPFGDGGRVNLTLSYLDQELTNRAGSPGRGAFDVNTALPNEIAFADADPTLGMIVGRPDLKQTSVFVNITHPLGENSEFYTTHGFTDRWNRSFAY